MDKISKIGIHLRAVRYCEENYNNNDYTAHDAIKAAVKSFGFSMDALKESEYDSLVRLVRNDMGIQ